MLEFGKEKLYIRVEKYMMYDNMALALYTEEGEPYVNLSVNIDSLPDGWCTIDTNNFPEGEELILKYHLGEKVGEIGSGFCKYPIYEMNMSEVNKYVRSN